MESSRRPGGKCCLCWALKYRLGWRQPQSPVFSWGPQPWDGSPHPCAAGGAEGGREGSAGCVLFREEFLGEQTGIPQGPGSEGSERSRP